MCGIAGIVTRRRLSNDTLREIGDRMQLSIAHRGPDGSGVWIDDAGRLVLAHRRLAIQDLSEAGAQPMVSASGRYVITYNGEIYNFGEIRTELSHLGQAPQWRGASDTEVLLAAVEAWGIGDTLRRTDGMFAFALWDRENQALTLARDKFGEKPLYYGIVGGNFVFGSELRALASACEGGLGEIDPLAAAAIVRSLSIPAPLSIFKRIRKLPPAAFVCVRRDDLDRQQISDPNFYWSAYETALTAIDNPFLGDESEAVDQMYKLLEQSIRRRLVADVPLGAMLSGGIDSSVICLVAQSVSSKPLRTFTIGFTEKEFDEAGHAEATAKLLETEHTTIRLGSHEVISAACQMAQIFDEPFADDSQLVTTALSRAMRRKVTVAVSGDGGDEICGGYVRHHSAPAIWKRLSLLPYPVRRSIASVTRLIGEGSITRLLKLLTGARGEQEERLRKFLGLVDSHSQEEMYERLLTVWPPHSRITMTGATFAHIHETDRMRSFRRRMMLADTVGYLPNDVLTKIDRASMSAALEVRAPFLDPAIFSFAWSLPETFLFDQVGGKRILRALLQRSKPELNVNRPKQGFSAPVSKWLRGPLKEWADDLLCFDGLRTETLFDGKKASAAWSSHRAGRSDESARLWPLLMLRAWKHEWRV